MRILSALYCCILYQNISEPDLLVLSPASPNLCKVYACEHRLAEQCTSKPICDYRKNTRYSILFFSTLAKIQRNPSYDDRRTAVNYIERNFVVRASGLYTKPNWKIFLVSLLGKDLLTFSPQQVYFTIGSRLRNRVLTTVSPTRCFLRHEGRHNYKHRPGTVPRPERDLNPGLNLQK